ncbi:hypothetical protein FUAX_04910 [Fulvitalea axinellae]|uniref:Uncharacterized protein n=1 Tax=Fulvitalea axinellae TaxID=1182444 RepID=A0AAU9D0U6_9BACT|nr:hypothetical protein FUAX_04910 [Fulvitalea axinellae]
MRLTCIIFLLLPTVGLSQGFLKTDTLTTYPKKIIDIAKQEIRDVVQVDFNGDGKKGYIIRTKPDKAGKEMEIWVNPEYTVFHRHSYFRGDYHFIQFINLDTDPEPEVYRATGYENGIDYEILDVNIKTEGLKRLFFFDPIISANDKTYWGYPWATKSVPTQKTTGNIRVKVSLNHSIKRDGEIAPLKKQLIRPAILLEGNADAFEIAPDRIGKPNWMSLEEVREAVFSTNKPNNSTKENEDLIEWTIRKDTLKIATTDDIGYFPFGKHSKRSQIVREFEEFSNCDINDDRFILFHNTDTIEFFNDTDQGVVQIVCGDISEPACAFVNSFRVGTTVAEVLEYYGVDGVMKPCDISVIMIETGVTGMWHYYQIQNNRIRRIIFETDYMF